MGDIADAQLEDNEGYMVCPHCMEIIEIDERCQCLDEDEE